MRLKKVCDIFNTFNFFKGVFRIYDDTEGIKYENKLH